MPPFLDKTYLEKASSFNKHALLIFLGKGLFVPGDFQTARRKSSLFLVVSAIGCISRQAVACSDGAKPKHPHCSGSTKSCKDYPKQTLSSFFFFFFYEPL